MIIPIVLIIAFIFIFIASYGTDHARLYDERWEWKYGTTKKEKRFFVIVRKHEPKDEEPKENTTQEHQEPPKEI